MNGGSGPAVTGDPPQQVPPRVLDIAEPGRWIRGALRTSASRLALVGVWVVMIAFYSVIEPSTFLTGSTFTSIFSSQQALVFLTVALLCTIIVGEFVDLSVPSVLALSATIVPELTVLHGWNVWLATLVALAACVLVGVVNGALVVFMGVNTIVVTLGMGTLLLGIGLWMTDSNYVSGLSASFAKIDLLNVAGLPISFFYGMGIILVFAYVLGFTPLGRHMRFVGANRAVSRLAGIRVNRIRFGAFVMAGLVAGVGGVLATAGLGGFNPAVSQTYLPGEILGLTGLVGSGFEEIPYLLAGATPATGGELRIGAQRTFSLPELGDPITTLRRAGVALVPERRVEDGLAVDMSVLEKLTLPRLRGRGSPLWSGLDWQREETRRMMDRLDIRPRRPDMPVSALSGGNQQKVLLAKWLAGDPRLLLLHEPTQAVDVGARADIIEVVRQAASDGCAVIVAGGDPQELAMLCDRVIVLRHGRVRAELTGELDEDAIVHATFTGVRGPDPAP